MFLDIVVVVGTQNEVESLARLLEIAKNDIVLQTENEEQFYPIRDEVSCLTRSQRSFYAPRDNRYLCQYFGKKGL